MVGAQSPLNGTVQKKTIPAQFSRHEEDYSVLTMKQLCKVPSFPLDERYGKAEMKHSSSFLVS